ncbi:MAG: FUSC family protein, partial [Luteibacter sp.]
FDDPTPIMRKMLVWTLVSIPIGAVYVFAILPLADGFIPLAIVLFPVIAIPAALMAVPRHALRALSVLLVTTTVIGLQPAYHGDMEAFANLALSSSLGTTIALLLTQAVRVIEGQWVAGRIVRSGWADLARLARRPPRSIVPFAMRMLDRVGLLLPRIPPASRMAASSLRDLRIGVGLSELMALGPTLDEKGMRHLAHLRTALVSHFEMLARRPDAVTPPHVIEALASLQPAIVDVTPYRARLRAVSAWVGLNQNLSPGTMR